MTFQKTKKFKQDSASSKTVLTAREQEIFDKLLAGISGKEIAQELRISYDTVNYHRKKLYKKLGVGNITELFTKYKAGYRVIPANMIMEDKVEPKRRLLLNILIPLAILITAAFLITEVLLQVQQKNKSFIAVIDPWYPVYNSGSKSQISRNNEMIDGKAELVVTISGSLFDDKDASGYEGFYAGEGLPYAGVIGEVSGKSLQAIRSMNSMSFKAKGDGSEYCIRFPTFETMDGDHYVYVFETVKDEIFNININIPGDIGRLGWSGKDADFIQNNIVYLQIQAVNPGAFHVKLWDFRFNQ
ncbi:MAG: helix-turn-helix transcriptional regulator [Treponema sp.]|nr:helix-turn-helix transcriptional regulator [Treponema sp.]